MQASSPAFTLQSFNTFDMSVGYTPTGSTTTFATPKYVGDKFIRDSISPMEQMQLAFAEEQKRLTYGTEELIDLTASDDDDESYSSQRSYQEGETYEKAIDLTNDDVTQVVKNTTTASTGTWHGVAFSEEGLVMERTNGGITDRICTPYFTRKPMVSHLAPTKQPRSGRGGDIKHPITNKRTAY